MGEPSRDNQDTERTQILAALHQTGWRVRGAAGAAALPGLKPTTLESRIKEARASASSLNGSPIRHVGVPPTSRAFLVCSSSEIQDSLSSNHPIQEG